MGLIIRYQVLLRRLVHNRWISLIVGMEKWDYLLYLGIWYDSLKVTLAINMGIMGLLLTNQIWILEENRYSFCPFGLVVYLIFLIQWLINYKESEGEKSVERERGWVFFY
jgi:hypothetical protein